MTTRTMSLIGACALTMLMVSGCYARGVVRSNVGYRPGAVVVYEAPPAPRVVVQPVAPPYQGAVWIDGHWNWSGASWVWVDGYWEQPRAGYIYVTPRWEQRGRSWVQSPGGWRARGQVHTGPGQFMQQGRGRGRGRGGQVYQQGGNNNVYVQPPGGGRPTVPVR